MDENKSVLIGIISLFIMVVLVVSWLVGQSMYADYQIGKAVFNGSDPIVARCAFGSSRDLYTDSCKNLKTK